MKSTKPVGSAVKQFGYADVIRNKAGGFASLQRWFAGCP